MMEEESVLSQHYRIFFGWDNKRGLFVTFYTQWGRTECSWVMGRVLLLWASTQLWKIFWCCIVIQKLCYHRSHPNLQSSFNSRFTAQSRFISHLNVAPRKRLCWYTDVSRSELQSCQTCERGCKVALEELDHTPCPLLATTIEICKHLTKLLFLYFSDQFSGFFLIS